MAIPRGIYRDYTGTYIAPKPAPTRPTSYYLPQVRRGAYVAPTAPTSAPAKAPSTPTPAPTPAPARAPSRTTARYTPPTFTAPSVPDYQAILAQWLGQFPTLALPESEREEYLTRAGEEFRPYFEAQRMELERRGGEEERARLEKEYGRGLVGGVTLESLGDVNKRITELLAEMALKEESTIAQRATEMEQLSIQNAMSQHAQRVQDWALKSNLSLDVAKQTFTDQMAKLGFEAEQAERAWARSFEAEKFDWQKDLAEWEKTFKETELGLKYAPETTPTFIDETPGYEGEEVVTDEETPGTEYYSFQPVSQYWWSQLVRGKALEDYYKDWSR